MHCSASKYFVKTSVDVLFIIVQVRLLVNQVQIVVLSVCSWTLFFFSTSPLCLILLYSYLVFAMLLYLILFPSLLGLVVLRCLSPHCTQIGESACVYVCTLGVCSWCNHILSLNSYSSFLQNQKSLLKHGKIKKMSTWLMQFMSVCN